MISVGYGFLCESLGLSAFAPSAPAYVAPVMRVQMVSNGLALPRHVAPSTKDPFAHVLFALKHEGTNLQILAEAMPKIPAQAMLDELKKSPNGTYLRLACFLSVSHFRAPSRRPIAWRS